MYISVSIWNWWNNTDRGKIEALGEEPVAVPLCPPQISQPDLGSKPGLHDERLAKFKDHDLLNYI